MRTEIIPFEPDQADTCEGKSERQFLPSIHPSWSLLYLHVANQNWPSSALLWVSNNANQPKQPTSYQHIRMIFYINNQEHPWVASLNLAQTLTELNLGSQRGIAIAVNNAVVPKADWSSYAIHPNDRVTIIRATQGG